MKQSISQKPIRCFVHHREDGSVAKVEHTNVPTPLVGHKYIEVPFDPSLFAPSLAPRHRVVDGVVVAKPAAELATLDESVATRDVAMRIQHELKSTDAFMVPDYPIPEETRAKWRTYRQELRDLSKRGLTAAQQAAAWPLAPDSPTG